MQGWELVCRNGMVSFERFIPFLSLRLFQFLYSETHIKSRCLHPAKSPRLRSLWALCPNKLLAMKMHARSCLQFRSNKVGLLEFLREVVWRMIIEVRCSTWSQFWHDTGNNGKAPSTQFSENSTGNGRDRSTCCQRRTQTATDLARATKCDKLLVGKFLMQDTKSQNLTMSVVRILRVLCTVKKSLMKLAMRHMLRCQNQVPHPPFCYW